MAILQAKAAAEETSLLPLVVVPYLGEDALRELESRAVSGLDMCGNGILMAPEFRIWRSGAPNRFTDSRPIKNPYRGDSSIFARCFLLSREYTSLGDLQTFALQRTFEVEGPGAQALSLATASKVVASLEGEMVVAKQSRGLRLVNPRRLLDLLRPGNKDPIRQCIAGKTQLTSSEIWARLKDLRSEGMLRSVTTGLGSAERYRVLLGNEKLSLYVDDIGLASEALEIQLGRPFANIEVWAETKNYVYFDGRDEGNVRWASPIQTWLELISAGSREQQAAAAMEAMLLEGNVENLP
jgi:hypothetical protein